MSDIQLFRNPEFGEVRILEENGEILFCGSDVAKTLGYTNPSKALSDHCRGVTKRYTPTTSGKQEMSFIPESDLYRLVFSSKLPTAEKFTDWVTKEILPFIRRHGLYATPEAVEQMLNNPDMMIKALTALKDEREKRKALEAEAALNKPKVLFSEAVASSHNSILIGDLAKLIRQNGVPVGQKRLFEILRQEGFLISRGEARNMPTQKAMEAGLMEIKETTIASPDGFTRVTKTPKITGKGQVYFINRYLGRGKDGAR